MLYPSVDNNQHCYYGQSAVTIHKTSINPESETIIKLLHNQCCCSFYFILRIVVIYHPYTTLYHLFQQTINIFIPPTHSHLCHHCYLLPMFPTVLFIVTTGYCDSALACNCFQIDDSPCGYCLLPVCWPLLLLMLLSTL